MSCNMNLYFTKTLYEPAHEIINEIFTDSILEDFYNSLLEVFKGNIPVVYTDEPYEVDGEIYRDLKEGDGPSYDFSSSTGGWYDALNMMLDNHPDIKKKYHEFYSKNIKYWMDADTFAGDIEAKLSVWYEKNIVNKKDVK